MGKENELLQVVKEGNVNATKKMIMKMTNSKNKKTNVNTQDDNGMTPLHHASLTGNLEMMKLLLDHGCHVDAKDNKGLRPLHYSAWKGNELPVSLLLKANSSINEAADDGNTALHLACEHGHLVVVSILLQHGGDFSLRNKQLKTPFDLACEFGKTRVVTLILQLRGSHVLLANSPQDTIDNNSTTCLHLAAKNGHIDVIKSLIKAGIDINRQTLQGTCLHEASKYGKIEIVKLLLNCGIDASKLNSYEQTALEIVNKYTTNKGAKELKQLLKDAPMTEHRDSGVSSNISVSVLKSPTQFNAESSDVTPKQTLIKQLNSPKQLSPNGLQNNKGTPVNSNNVSLTTISGSNRFSNQSYESGVSTSSRQSFHSGHSSAGSGDGLAEENAYAVIKNFPDLISQGLSDADILHRWLLGLNMPELTALFIDAGYNIATITRMTPEDLNAIGITRPNVRKRLRMEINRLNIPDGIPDFIPANLSEWLRLLNLQQYEQTLLCQGYKDLRSVMQITWEDFEDIGIKKLGHQKKLTLAIDRLKKLHSKQRNSIDLTNQISLNNQSNMSKLVHAEVHSVPSPSFSQSEMNFEGHIKDRSIWDYNNDNSDAIYDNNMLTNNINNKINITNTINNNINITNNITNINNFNSNPPPANNKNTGPSNAQFLLNNKQNLLTFSNNSFNNHYRNDFNKHHANLVNINEINNIPDNLPNKKNFSFELNNLSNFIGASNNASEMNVWKTNQLDQRKLKNIIDTSFKPNRVMLNRALSQNNSSILMDKSSNNINNNQKAINHLTNQGVTFEQNNMHNITTPNKNFYYSNVCNNNNLSPRCFHNSRIPYSNNDNNRNVHASGVNNKFINSDLNKLLKVCKNSPNIDNYDNNMFNNFHKINKDNFNEEINQNTIENTYDNIADDILNNNINENSTKDQAIFSATSAKKALNNILDVMDSYNNNYLNNNLINNTNNNNNVNNSTYESTNNDSYAINSLLNHYMNNNGLNSSSGNLNYKNNTLPRRLSLHTTNGDLLLQKFNNNNNSNLFCEQKNSPNSKRLEPLVTPSKLASEVMEANNEILQLTNRTGCFASIPTSSFDSPSLNRQLPIENHQKISENNKEIHKNSPQLNSNHSNTHFFVSQNKPDQQPPPPPLRSNSFNFNKENFLKDNDVIAKLINKNTHKQNDTENKAISNDKMPISPSNNSCTTSDMAKKVNKLSANNKSSSEEEVSEQQYNESNIFPFANENAGTIKSRANNSIVKSEDFNKPGENKMPSEANKNKSKDGVCYDANKSYDTNTIKANNTNNNFVNTNAKNTTPSNQEDILNNNKELNNFESINCRKGQKSEETVFSDIDGILKGLTQELDQMMKPQ